MRALILIAIIVSAYFGFISVGWHGFATGVVAALALGSSLLIFLGRGKISFSRDLQFMGSLGSFSVLIICITCLYLGGWKYGWAWVIPGYILGIGLMFLMTEAPFKANEEASKKMIDSFISDAKANLGYDPDEDSVEFLKENMELTTLIWEMLGDAGANVGIHGNNKWSKECDYLLNNYVVNEAFKEANPGAHALIRYTIYLCDGKSGYKLQSDKPRCNHPIDDFST